MPGAFKIGDRVSCPTVRIAQNAIRTRARAMQALSGDSTPKNTYRLLAQPARRRRASGSRVSVHWGREVRTRQMIRGLVPWLDAAHIRFAGVVANPWVSTLLSWVLPAVIFFGRRMIVMKRMITDRADVHR